MPYGEDEVVEYSDTFELDVTYTPSLEDPHPIFIQIVWPGDWATDAYPDDAAVAFQALVDELALLPSFSSGGGTRYRRYTSNLTPTSSGS